MAHFEASVEDAIFQRFIEEMAIQQVSIPDAVNAAIKEWCENRAYLRSGREERRRLMWKVGGNADAAGAGK